jgi:uncharacterized protein with NRDE domain
MCLLVLAWQAHRRYRLVVAANRDEYHRRPAAALARWSAPEILGGRDLEALGTWLALDRARRFGVVTNFRELQPPRPASPSRGALIPRYLSGSGAPREFFAGLEGEAARYSGFNLLISDADSLWYGSNRATPFARALDPGVYGLANELLDTPWPKLTRVRGGFEQWLARAAPASPQELFALLGDRTAAAEMAAPGEVGRPPADRERALSAPFVAHPEYGTRCSTVLLQEHDGRVYLAERRFAPGGEPAGETEFRLNAGEWP